MIKNWENFSAPEWVDFSVSDWLIFSSGMMSNVTMTSGYFSLVFGDNFKSRIASSMQSIASSEAGPDIFIGGMPISTTVQNNIIYLNVINTSSFNADSNNYCFRGIPVEVGDLGNNISVEFSNLSISDGIHQLYTDGVTMALDSEGKLILNAFSLPIDEETQIYWNGCPFVAARSGNRWFLKTPVL